MTGVNRLSGFEAVELHVGALRLALRPDLGGCIAGLWHHDVPVLRSTDPARLQAARQSAAYPLVPYSNRIGFRRFSWEGRDYTTLPNFDDSPHSLHGVGWTGAWQLESSSAIGAVLKFMHTGDAAWPFAFAARQVFSLTADHASVRMVFTNTAELAQPVGLGWHPYFVKRERSHLQIDLSDRWENGASGLPVRKVAQPGIDSDVASLRADNCFEGWQGPALIRDDTFSLQLSSSMHRLVIYTPYDRDYFCVEPVSHVSDAIHMAEPASRGLRIVPPGGSIEASMTLRVALI